MQQYDMEKLIVKLQEENKRLERRLTEIESKLMVDTSCQKMLSNDVKTSKIILYFLFPVSMISLLGIIILLGSK